MKSDWNVFSEDGALLVEKGLSALRWNNRSEWHFAVRVLHATFSRGGVPDNQVTWAQMGELVPAMSAWLVDQPEALVAKITAGLRSCQFNENVALVAAMMGKLLGYRETATPYDEQVPKALQPSIIPAVKMLVKAGMVAADKQKPLRDWLKHHGVVEAMVALHADVLFDLFALGGDEAGWSRWLAAHQFVNQGMVERALCQGRIDVLRILIPEGMSMSRWLNVHKAYVAGVRAGHLSLFDYLEPLAIARNDEGSRFQLAKRTLEALSTMPGRDPRFGKALKLVPYDKRESLLHLFAASQRGSENELAFGRLLIERFGPLDQLLERTTQADKFANLLRLLGWSPLQALPLMSSDAGRARCLAAVAGSEAGMAAGRR